jgi:hypothetical protein
MDSKDVEKPIQLIVESFYLALFDIISYVPEMVYEISVHPDLKLDLI